MGVLGLVQKYIQTFQHLPELPTADSVEKNGLDVGSNQALLLKKIEELTLYTIEQDRRLDAQQKELDEMKAILKKITGH